MTTKQFISRLGELGLIPLPGNIRSRRFKFGDGPKAVERLGLGDVKTPAARAPRFPDRTKLYVLLCLNCGMYQSDISDIGEDEVDWTAGTGVSSPEQDSQGATSEVQAVAGDA